MTWISVPSDIFFLMHANIESYPIPQMPSQLSRLSVKFVQRLLRSPGRCWTGATLTSCCGRPVLRCSVALAAATPKACSVSLSSHTPNTCRWTTTHRNVDKCLNILIYKIPERRWVMFVIFFWLPSSLQPFQVMKIEYINKRPTYAKAVVSVVDHVECRCQPTPRHSMPKKKSSRKQHSHQHQNQTLSQGQGHEQVQSNSYFT